MKNNKLKKHLTFLILLFFICTSTFSQNYNIGTENNKTLTTCSGTLVDDGGASGNYGNNRNLKVTICSGTTDHIRLDFSKIAMEMSAFSSDKINIYDGNSTAAPQIANIFGIDLSLGFKPVYLSSGSCITVEFISDSSGNAAGFEAAISCVQNTDIRIGSVASVTGCSGIITDDGGFAGNYTNSKNLTTFSTKGSGKSNIQKEVFQILVLCKKLSLRIIPIHFLRHDPRIKLADDS